ncbi:uncharacterized protein LOC121980528 isoform X1 [Zingiber officinale]|uniref:uncharacterized protein LOC121980528 isoform X1 n=1 Tax=Zingiber officinale TaxID=94328 RepID=UPI001C4B8FF5|nr:uncharacterized protein LOC121980528 isoform X1 [Zingiber officinale]
MKLNAFLSLFFIFFFCGKFTIFRIACINIVWELSLEAIQKKLKRRGKARDMKQYDRECMKIAMLKQEEIFRYQVHELHRLYNIQKLLMREMKKADMKRQRYKPTDGERDEKGRDSKCDDYCDWRQQPRHLLDLALSAEEYIERHKGEVMLTMKESNDLELKLATGSNRTPSKKNDTRFTSDSGSSFSSSSNDSEFKKQVFTKLRNDRKGGCDIQKQMRKEEIKQPNWLFPCSKQDMLVSFGL